VIWIVSCLYSLYGIEEQKGLWWIFPVELPDNGQEVVNPSQHLVSP
jgi:hypothetical protein